MASWAASSDVGSSILSQGHWVKVHVSSSSVYRLPHALLEELGFHDPSRIIVAGYGSVERAHTLDTAPDDLPVLPVCRKDDAVYFYGEGDERVRPDGTSASRFTAHYNYYSVGSCYFIGERDGYVSPDIETGERLGGTADKVLRSHTAICHRVFRDNHPSRRGLALYSKDFAGSGDVSVEMPVDGNDGTATLYYSYIWKHSNSSAQSIGVAFSDAVTSSAVSNDRLTKNSSISHLNYSLKQNSCATLTLDKNADKLRATFRDNAGAFSVLALANATLVYTRFNDGFASPQCDMYFPGLTYGSVIGFEDVPDSFAVWDVTSPRSPVNLPLVRDDAAGVTVHPAYTTDEVSALHAFTLSPELPIPEVAGEIAPQSLHAISDIDMLIVTTDATHSAAQRLAEAHERWQGMNVAVVKQSDVYNEFSSGVLHPNGIRHLTMRLASQSGRLRYLLLFGHGSWDTRADVDKSGNTYLATYSTEDAAEMCYDTKTYCSDMYFGTVSGQSISPSLARMRADASISVGRVPAYDAASAETYVDKCIAYLSEPSKAGAFNHAIISGGIGDSNAHLDASETVGGIIAECVTLPTIYRSHLSLFALTNKGASYSEYMHGNYMARFAGDARLFDYNGHSGITAINHNNHTVAHEADAHYGSLPVVFMASCSTTPIDLPEVSLGETMLFHNPGPVAVIGAGGEVFMNYNNNLNNSFVRMFYSADGGECIGDVFRLAVNATKPHVDQHTNNLCYNFLGDPALPRYNPLETVALRSINGIDISEMTAAVSVPGCSRLTLYGTVNTADGHIDTSYNGLLTIDIYEAPTTRTTLKHDSSDTPKGLTIDEYSICTATVNVTAGEWSSEIILPATSHTGINRMTFNAISEDRVFASGASGMLTIDSNSDAADTSGDANPPEIIVWLDSPDKADGCEVSSTATLHIEIYDPETGVSLNASSIGLMPKVFYDGTSVPQAGTVIHSTESGRAVGEYTFDGLSDGRHTVSVTARDLAGNIASRTVNFTVRHHETSATLTASSAIVRDDVTLSLSGSVPSGVTSQRLIIRDMDGNTVVSHDGVFFPYTWDLRASDGSMVPDGSYRASVIISAHPYYLSSTEVQFTIVKL